LAARVSGILASEACPDLVGGRPKAPAATPRSPGRVPNRLIVSFVPAAALVGGAWWKLALRHKLGLNVFTARFAVVTVPFVDRSGPAALGWTRERRWVILAPRTNVSLTNGSDESGIPLGHGRRGAQQRSLEGSGGGVDHRPPCGIAAGPALDHRRKLRPSRPQPRNLSAPGGQGAAIMSGVITFRFRVCGPL
jgi:hypothetical protein